MERRKFLQKATLGSLAVGSLTSCISYEQSKNTISLHELNQGTIVHNVYFWLKEGLAVEEENQFLDFVKILKTVPGVQSLQLSKPAPTNPRPVVDNSFSYNIMVTFKNMDDINIYETHQIHLDAVEKFKHLWTKVEVKDSVIV